MEVIRYLLNEPCLTNVFAALYVNKNYRVVRIRQLFDDVVQVFLLPNICSFGLLHTDKLAALF